jgi:Phage integrase, N-terminal SAM-like domain
MPSMVEPELLAMAALNGRPRERVCGDGGQLGRNGHPTHVIDTSPACALCLAPVDMAELCGGGAADVVLCGLGLCPRYGIVTLRDHWEWRAYFTRRGLLLPVADADLLADPAGLDRWLDEHDVLDGQPFLLDPSGRYDVTLNSFFTAELFAEPRNTQLAVAHDLKRFLTFLWESRGERSWRDASPEDRAAFKRWRLFDPEGPHVESSTWDREVATVNRFYRWAVRRGHVRENPIVQRESRVSPFRRSDGREVPAEASRTGPRRHIAWLTPAMYRQWRDVGVRGLDLEGRPDPGFRGRFASRKAAYTDLMFRTGLRLAEQTSLSLFEVPELAGGVVNARGWLPARIAKAGSARHFYVPAPVLKDVLDYVEMERAEAVERGLAAGVYERMRDPFIVEDPSRPRVRLDGRWEPVTKLDASERLRLLIDTGAGLAPAALWLTDDREDNCAAFTAQGGTAIRWKMGTSDVAEAKDRLERWLDSLDQARVTKAASTLVPAGPGSP